MGLGWLSLWSLLLDVACEVYILLEFSTHFLISSGLN